MTELTDKRPTGVSDDITPCYYIVLDTDGGVVELNPLLRHDLGLGEGEPADTLRFTDLLTAGSKVFYQTHFFPLIKLHGNYNELYLTFRTRSGEEIPALLNARMHATPASMRIVCAGLRMSRRNQFENELIEARNLAERALNENAALNALKTELEKSHEELESRLRRVESHALEQEQIISIISHELQEPLRKIALFSKMMLDQKAVQPPGWDTHLSKIFHSSFRIREMVFSIQKYMSLGEKVFSPERVDIGELIGRVKDQNDGLLHGTRVDLSVSPHTPILKGDAALLENLFAELFANSVKFAEPSRQLEIRIEVDSVEDNFFKKIGDRYKFMEFVRVRFSDNGSGFPPKYHEEIFKLFKKAHIFDDGLGFGLAYCKKVVDLHHGSIGAQSELDHGTTISVLLPASA